jgi:hypothetical protein
MATKTNKVLFSKLATFLSTRSYILSGVYCDGEYIKFIELRTPKLQKTFIIHIPSKYKMKTMPSITCHKVDIKAYPRSQGDDKDTQLEYLMEIKGMTIENKDQGPQNNILAISSSQICLYKDDGNVFYFKIGNYDSEEPTTVAEGPTTVTEVKKGSNVDHILRKVKKIDDKIDNEEGLQMPVDDQEEKEDLAEEEHVEETNEELPMKEPAEQPVAEQEEKIELVFQDDQGNVIDDQSKIQNEKPSIPIVRHFKDNSLPSTIEDENILLGIIYYSIDLDEFYSFLASKRGPELETIILDTYDSFDTNENEMREAKVQEISDLAERLTKRTKDELEKYRLAETELKNQVLKLSAVLTHSDNLKIKASSKTATKKLTDVKLDVEKVYNQTKITLHEINIEILRLRDCTDQLLTYYQSSLEEMLKMNF